MKTLLASLVLAGFAAQAQISVDPKTTYVLDPVQVKAGVDFELGLLSHQFNCGTTFDNLTTVIDGNRINLGFLDHAHPEAICPAIYKPYGPSYKLAGLKPGVYQVHASRLPACYPCRMASEDAFAGTLTVGDAPGGLDGWFLKEDKVKANASFSMQLLNNRYGNCQTAFTHATATAQANAIYTTFAIESHPENICIVNIIPWGPIFAMEALKPGRYPVYASVVPACVFSTPACLPPVQAPQVVDTLTVGEAGVLGLAGSSQAASGTYFRGDRLGFALPGGAGGVWRVDLLAPDGKNLRRFRVEGEAGAEVELKAEGTWRGGLYLVRLERGGETHMLRVVRQP